MADSSGTDTSGEAYCASVEVFPPIDLNNFLCPSSLSQRHCFLNRHVMIRQPTLAVK